jgi:hypothetical protein
MEKASLHYSIFLGWLWGTAGDESFGLSAWSGGRGGSTTPHAVDPATVNNPFRTGQKTDHAHGVHGGPLPIGEYHIATPHHHPHLGLSAQLTYHSGGLTFGLLGRGDDFFIHGHGPHGSDGCIVPDLATEFHRLMDALTKSHGGELSVWP